MKSIQKQGEPKAWVLIVDDEVDILRVIELGLSAQGYAVKGYPSSTRALEEFKPNSFDIAILDIRMPVMNGFQLYAGLKEKDPCLTCLFLTAYEIYEPEFTRMYGEDSLARFVRKPVSIVDLAKHIEHCLERRRRLKEQEDSGK